jgi:predicted ribosomally synthesized peptide with nif11-like leader
MSSTEAERFVNDLAKNQELVAALKPQATGLASVVAFGKQHGYDFTLDEAKQYIQSRSPRELTDTQLDAIAGGKKHGGGSVKVTSNIAAATNTVEAAETMTTAVTNAEAAVEAVAAASGAAVVVIAAVVI